MTERRVLVVGATGMLGHPVAQRLLTNGWQVRCLVRDVQRAATLLGPGFELVTGDVTQPATLDAAFAGCTHLHLNLRGTNTVASYQANEVNGAKSCLEAAQRHNFKLVSYLSGAGRRDTALERHFVVRVKKTVEQALQANGLPWIAWRATHFMESLPQFVRDGRATILGRQPERLHYVAAGDYARMVAQAFNEPSCWGRPLYVFGPQALTMREAVSLYVAARHPGMTVGTLPLPIARALAGLTDNADLRFATELFAAFRDIGEDGDPSEANRLLGPPRTTIQHWLRGEVAG